jgi:hypothetical protein
MNKHTIELNIPEGYEPDDGEQPRIPKVGDFLMDEYFDILEQVSEPLSSKRFNKAIILRKKNPVYQLLDLREDGCAGLKYVEIKALEDAMKILENMNMNPDLDMFECDAYGPLKELLK